MRILSLLPAATEIVDALGAADELVGVSHECDYPPRIATLPRATRSSLQASSDAAEIDRAVRQAAAAGAPLFELDESLIGALAPDVILTQALCDVCAVSEDDVRAIAARLPTMPTIITVSATRLADVLTDVRRIAGALGRDAAGDAAVADAEARWRAVHDVLAAAHAPRPRVAVIEWTHPLFVAGHWVPEMVRRAGGEDVLCQPGVHSRTVSIEAVQRARPDVMVFAPCGYDCRRAAVAGRSLLDSDEWSWARHSSCWAIDGNALTSRPGLRLVQGVETLAALLHPSLFAPPDERWAERLTASG